MKIRAVKGIRNAHYLENGAVDCEVLFEGETEFVPYTAMRDDSARTGRYIWRELQSGKWGEVAPFTVTPERIAAAKAAKKQEIEAWRTEQEALAFTFEWNGRTWNGGASSVSRLTPAVMTAKSESREETEWSDAENRRVKLSLQKLEELLTAMVQEQVIRNDEIYRRQREMKDELNNLEDLSSIRAMTISSS
ncbi:DUF4376 domain-containing protein [Escherichia coli]|nr:DUF4376 domain-containing protein [Escherichia coli]EIP7907788.1 DUF4376 domain-containing protein [Escherichia coli]